MALNVLITGTTSGIGAATAETLAAQGHRLWLLNRNLTKTTAQIEELTARYGIGKFNAVHCDLNELQTIRKAAANLASLERIDVLINNAGGLTQARETTIDGFETQFQMNHLGHFLLTQLLLPQLLNSGARVINLSSEAHRAAQLDLNDLQGQKRWSSFGAYANAKLCNILFTKGLHKRYGSHGLLAYALHPGVVNTGFGNGLGSMRWMWQLMTPFLISPAKGAATSLFLATTSEAPAAGAYYKNRKEVKASGKAQNEQLADGLWEKSLSLLAPWLP
jgi:NAD(P)-dependent dehydrogenase (short-subunit alcohol dehydrogenase family)